MTAPRPSIVGTLLFLLSGPIVWALHLLVTYASHASMCAVGAGQPAAMTPLPAVLTIATLIAAGVLLGIAVRPSIPRRLLGALPASHPGAAFADKVAQLLAILSLFGVAFAGLAILILPTCAQLR